MYGNVATQDPWMSHPLYYDATANVTTKKLWVAAIDLNGTAGTDPSHPAFYLPGQELHAGNSRGFWTTGACMPNGSTCQTGDECCGGFCAMNNGTLSCSAQSSGCSQVYEKCMTSNDCCGASQGVQCINSICTQIVL
jgi:hypothetical protein